jgi:hypothetical protein
MNLYKIIGTSLAAAALLAQTSCLKDVKSNSDPSLGSNSVVEFQNSSIPVSYTSIYPQYNSSLIFAPDTAGFNVNINYAGANNGAPQDIQVNFTLDQDALDKFNADQQTSYIIPSADLYTLQATLTIPKGKRDATTRVIAHLTSNFDYSAAYALPLKISSSSYGVISSNFGTAIYTFSGRNKYDGTYSYTANLSGWGAYGIADGEGSYTLDNNIGVVTASATSVTTSDKDYGSLLLAFTTGGGKTGFGATTPLFTFDPATDKLVSVTNTTAPDSRNRTLKLDPAVTDSRYDPSTKTIYAAFIMSQTGRPDQHFLDTLVYQGVR